MLNIMILIGRRTVYGISASERTERMHRHSRNRRNSVLKQCALAQTHEEPVLDFQFKSQIQYVVSNSFVCCKRLVVFTIFFYNNAMREFTVVRNEIWFKPEYSIESLFFVCGFIAMTCFFYS